MSDAARFKRIRELRNEHNCGLVEAVGMWRQERLLKLLDEATAFEDLKAILRLMLSPR